MIGEAVYNRIYKQWIKVREPYQKWNRITTRMPLFLKYIDHLKGKSVVEIGCNAGIYGYEIAKVAKAYVGVDQGAGYIKQAEITKRHIDNPNVAFFARRVKGFIRDQQKAEERNVPAAHFNAWFSTFTLYHLADKETDLIKNWLLPKCDVVIIMTRTSKRSPWRKYNSMQLHKISNVEKFLTSAGFTCKSEMHESKKFGITLAIKEKKDGGDQRDGEGDKPRSRRSPTRRRTSVREGRTSKRSPVLSPERKAALQGPDGLHVPVQGGVVPEGHVQNRPRKVVSPRPRGGSKRMAEQEKAGTIRRNTKNPEAGEGKD